MLTVLEVLGADYSRPSTGIDKIVELNFTRCAIFFTCPFGTDGAAWIGRGFGDHAIQRGDVGGDKINGVDLHTVEGLGTAFGSVFEDHVVCFGSHDVPGIVSWTSGGDEICVYTYNQYLFSQILALKAVGDNLEDLHPSGLVLNLKAAPLYCETVSIHASLNNPFQELPVHLLVKSMSIKCFVQIDET